MSIVTQAPKAMFCINIAGQEKPLLAFFGTPLFAVPTLRALHRAGWPIAAVVTAPDKPVGRQMLLTPSPIKTAAQELALDVFSPMTLKDENFLEKFKELAPDICIVVAYGKLIPQAALDLPRLGFLNIHPSLLPAYRGPSPIQTAMLDGQTETGISIMLLDAEMDHGPILAQRKWTIPANADLPFCEDELSRLGAELLVETLPGYVAGDVKPLEQNHSQATVTHKFEREDGKLDWHSSAKAIHDRIRALAANPGTWTNWGERVLNVFHAHIAAGAAADAKPGTVFLHADGLAVACSDGALILETLQLQGSTKMSVKDFLNGRSAIVGSVLT